MNLSFILFESENLCTWRREKREKNAGKWLSNLLYPHLFMLGVLGGCRVADQNLEAHDTLHSFYAVCMSVCVCVHVCTHFCAWVCAFVRVCMCASVHVHVCMQVSVCASEYLGASQKHSQLSLRSRDPQGVVVN